MEAKHSFQNIYYFRCISFHSVYITLNLVSTCKFFSGGKHYISLQKLETVADLEGPKKTMPAYAKMDQLMEKHTYMFQIKGQYQFICIHVISKATTQLDEFQELKFEREWVLLLLRVNE